jgi:hypothetical protein
MKPPRWKIPKSLRHIKPWVYIGQLSDVDVWVNPKIRKDDGLCLDKRLYGVRVNNRTLYEYVTPKYEQEALRLIKPYLTPRGTLNTLFWARVKLEENL